MLLDILAILFAVVCGLILTFGCVVIGAFLTWIVIYVGGRFIQWFKRKIPMW